LRNYALDILHSFFKSRFFNPTLIPCHSPSQGEGSNLTTLLWTPWEFVFL
jgi:hypothetical protein